MYSNSRVVVAKPNDDTVTVTIRMLHSTDTLIANFHPEGIVVCQRFDVVLTNVNVNIF